MQFVSTRGRAPALSFSDAVLTGLARDGGLYVPRTWPHIEPDEIEAMADGDYVPTAAAILSRFAAGDPEAPDDEALLEMVRAAYSTFRHPSVAPIVEIGPAHYVLELFHGPTLAFKDVAMQFLARLVDHILSRRGQRATIVGATSGDTGSAAIEAFRGRDNIDIFIMHPKGRTSDVQRRQMTTIADANVHNIAIEGTFDDCQALLKGLFNNHRFRDSVQLSGVNSINFGRIAPQIVYYFKAAAQLGAPHREVAFTVPTGNFGDIFAGYAAKRMGLPIAALNIAANANDILVRTLETGRYETAAVIPTLSPSMDIQVSSNFERLLFEALGRDAAAVEGLMAGLAQSGGFAIPGAALAAIRADFAAARVDEAETAEAIRATYAACGYLLDPHTAVGVAVARQFHGGSVPMVTLATAHPAKFPAAVRAAAGIDPPLPDWLADLGERPERFTVLASDQAAVETFIAERTRVLEPQA